MRRFAAAIIAFSALTAGFGSQAVAEEYYCPPDAKYCPAPGTASAGAQTGDFGADFGLPQSGGPSDSQFAAFQSQLNEGEQLIMVAPSTGGGYASIAAVPPQRSMAPVRATGYNNNSGMAMNAPAPTPAPVSGGLDFIPPPPGSARSAAPQAPYSAPAQQPTYAAAPVRQAPPPAPVAPAVAAAPREQSRQAPKADRRNEARPEPKSFAKGRDYEKKNDLDEINNFEPARKKEVAKAQPRAAQPAKKQRRADMLAEVANETSRREGGKSETASKRDRDDTQVAERVPWWKGGMWRNRKKDKDNTEVAKAKTKAEKKAEKKRQN